MVPQTHHNMDERSAGLLNAVVGEFIRTGEPVSSAWIYKHHDFGIKPAMIRLELCGLTDHGYLAQPHSAAGRVPTDRGFEFYARTALEEETPDLDRRLRNDFLREDWPGFLSRFSEALGVLSAAAIFPGEDTYKSPLGGLMDSLEAPGEALKELVHDFEELDARLANAKRMSAEDFQVFAGKHSPITNSEFLSVMSASYGDGEGRVLICAIGPKRMDYRKTAKIFKGLRNARNK